MTLASGGVGVSDVPACGPPDSFSGSSAVTPAGSVHKSRGDNVVRMWMQLKRCRVCGCYRGGIVVMDVFWRRLCVSMIYVSGVGNVIKALFTSILFSAAVIKLDDLLHTILRLEVIVSLLGHLSLRPV